MYQADRGCVCSLKIPGAVPAGQPYLGAHFEFIAFLNKLSTHEMFDGFKIDKP